MNQSDKRFWVMAAATVGVLGLAYGPLLVEFFANQWARPHYQYFPFVLGAFAFLLWQRCAQAVPRESSDPAAARYDAVVALVVGWVLLGLAYVAHSPWLAYLSAICMVTSCFLRVASSWQVPYLWGIWLLLWLVVPLPLGRDQALINRLQHLSSWMSSFVLDWVGVRHLMEGNTLILPEKQFFVDEACSGIVSVMSIIACAVIYGVWRNRSPLHLVLLATLGVGWATVMNVVRISVIAMAFDWWNVDWSKGMPHEILGLVIFLFTFLVLVSTDYALVVLLDPIKPPDGQLYEDPMTFGAWLVDAWDWVARAGSLEPGAWSVVGAGSETQVSGVGFRVSDGGEMGNESSRAVEQKSGSGENDTTGRLTVGERRKLASRFVLGVVPLMAFGTLAVFQIAISLWLESWPAPPTQCFDRALALEASALRKKLGNAGQISFKCEERARDDVFGNHSRIYEYKDGNESTYLASCDFPLEAGGHELTVCYQGIGWKMENRALKHVATDSDEPTERWDFAEANFTKPDGSAAFLVFCAFDEYGTRVSPPSYTLWDDLWRSLEKQFLTSRSQHTFQVQVWTTATGTVREEQKRVARELLLDARERFRKLVAGEEGQGAGSRGSRRAKREK